MQLILNPELTQFFSPIKKPFKHIMHLKGEVFRALENRCTQRVVLNSKNYFIKQHYGIGWKEIFKNLFQLRLPIVSAKNEWLALQRLHQLNIDTQTIAGYGKQGLNPASMQSFLITEELPPHITLEDFCRNWKTQPPTFRAKQRLIHEVARIARTLHENGINHRDFYICHFLLKNTAIASLKNRDEKVCLYLIDLHRAQIRQSTPERWVIKDLAGLYFSSLDIGLTKRDLLRFIREYRNSSLMEVFNKEPAFWQRVKQRGDKLYRKHAN